MEPRTLTPSAQSLHEQAIRQMLERTRLSPQELSAHLARAEDPAYWKQLVPIQSVGKEEAGSVIESVPMPPERHEELVRQVARDGYFQTEPILDPALVARMRQGIEVVRQEGWPPVFTYVFDEFWQAPRAPSLQRFLTAVLGPEYRQVAQIWAHHVQPVLGASGWQPHVDGRKRPHRVTVWIPLTDATLENGCMYVVSRASTPRHIAEEFTRLDTVAMLDMTSVLEGARALPARAGSILGWELDVIHWGSTCTRPGEPRISISMQFIGADTPGEADEVPLLDAHTRLPTFAERGYVIGRAIVDYERFELGLIRFVELAKRLVERSGPQAVCEGKSG